MDDLARLQDSLHVNFHSPALLQQALVHRSYLNEIDAGPISNERLEFLGDAVLGLVVADELFRRFPGLSEGGLTELRAQLVRGAALAPVGARLDLGAYLVLGHGEERSGGRRRQINLARALEALLGAVYLDQGLQASKALILRLLEPEFSALDPNDVALNPKSRLQQLAQGEFHVTPNYLTTGSTGNAEARIFTVEVRFGDRVVGAGSGKSKRLAQQDAARAALEHLTAGRS